VNLHLRDSPALGNVRRLDYQLRDPILYAGWVAGHHHRGNFAFLFECDLVQRIAKLVENATFFSCVSA
jgi:hypothetical protein